MLRSASLALATTAFLPFTAAAQELVSATLAGHAVLPAFSFSSPPADAPRVTWISRRFAAGASPVHEPQTLIRNGVRYPIIGQPIQGFSGYAAHSVEDGSLYALIDNGSGSQANSSDALLGFTRISETFDIGEITVLDRGLLHDSDHRSRFASRVRRLARAV